MRLVCPKCRNAGFKSSKDVPKPLSIYKTDSFPTVVYRYRICLQCGYKWVSKDEFERAVGSASRDLFSPSDADEA